MTDAPERIWVDDRRSTGGRIHICAEKVKGWDDVEYIRADLAEAIVAAALNEARKAIASEISWSPYIPGSPESAAWMEGALTFAKNADKAIAAQRKIK